jgi:hypothetical protein
MWWEEGLKFVIKGLVGVEITIIRYGGGTAADLDNV